MTRIVGVMARLVILYSLALSETAAHVKPPGSDSVTDDQLAIRDFTQYDTERQHALAQWHALSPVWVYAWFTGQPIDLVMEDYNNCGDGRNACYNQSLGKIRFNECKMNQNTAAQRKKTATHEVGHALGLAHSFSGQVMYAYTASTNTLQAHDICDYNIYWNGSSYCSCHDPCFAGGGS